MNTLKAIICPILLAGVLLTAPSQICGQGATAVTNPVGFIVLNIAGTGGTVSSALSFIGLSMAPQIVYAGQFSSATSSTVTDSNAAWAYDQFDGASGYYYVTLTSGPGAGVWADVTGTNGTTLTVNVDLSSYISPGTTYQIQPNWTIGEIFGTDPTAPGASGLAGGTSSSADQVLIYRQASNDSNDNPIAAHYDTYYYKTSGLGGIGWRVAGNNSRNAAGDKLEPTDGIIVQRQQTAPIALTLTGNVKLGPTNVPIKAGSNFISIVYPAGNLTLGNSGLYNPTDPAGNTLVGGTSSSADQVLLYRPASVDANNNPVAAHYDTYFYKLSGLGGTGWRVAGNNSTAQDNTPLPFGSSIIIQRFNKTVNVDGSFEWMMPQPF